MMHKKQLINTFYNFLYEKLGPQNWWPGDTPEEVMIGAILTQNTNWENVEKAINNLKDDNACNFNSISKINSKRLAELIRQAGYFNQKAKKLKLFAAYFGKQYAYSIENIKNQETDSLRKQLLRIWGVGPETADSILLYALEKPVFVIDAYTKRIFTRHKLAPKKDDYDTWRMFFEDNLVTDIKVYNEYHALIVNVGKNFCKPQKTLCDKCPLKSFKHVII